MDSTVLQGILILAIVTLGSATFADAGTGGEFAKPGEFPHAVQLLSYKRLGGSSTDFSRACDGSILAPRVVLTSAQCAYWDLSFNLLPYMELYVTAGTLKNLEISSREELESIREKYMTRTVEHYVIHPNFNPYIPYSLQDGVALLFLDEPLIYSDEVKSILLPPKNAVYSRGTLVGWGITDGRNRSAPFLKKIDLVLQEKETCRREALKMKPILGEVTDSLRCAKSEGSGFCSNYRGSSLICQDGTIQNGTNVISTPTICGIASGQISSGGCGDSGSIQLVVNVSHYLDWIEEEIKKNDADELNKRKVYRRIWFVVEIIFCVAVPLLFCCCLCCSCCCGILDLSFNELN